MQDALVSLDEALDKIDELEQRCCEPGRSPAMAALRQKITAAQAAVAASDESALAEHLEDAGAHVGRLQVGCCAPGRMPLYAAVLEDLTRARLWAGPAMHTG